MTLKAEEDPRGTQYRIILYFGLALSAYLLFFVSGARLGIVATSLLVMPLAFLLSRGLGESGKAAWEMFVVAILAAATYGAALILDPPTQPHGYAAALWALLLTQGIWAVGRYPTTPPETVDPLSVDLLGSLLTGLGTALGFSLYAGVIVGLAALGDDPAATGDAFGLVVLAYFAAGMLGGTMVGLMKPWRRWPLGTIATGVVVGFLIYLCVGVVLPYLGDEPEPVSWSVTVGMAATLGILGGPAASLMLKHGD